MNWWSGAAWCKANGMRLATMYEMCPSWNGGKGANRCPELKIDGGNVMSATASGSDGAFIVIMSSGEVRSGYGYFQRHNAACAFCI